MITIASITDPPGEQLQHPRVPEAVGHVPERRGEDRVQRAVQVPARTAAEKAARRCWLKDS